MSFFTATFTLIGALIWLALAFWPARVAGRKGRSFLGFFIFSLFFFPLALLVAYLLPGKTNKPTTPSAPATS